MRIFTHKRTSGSTSPTRQPGSRKRRAIVLIGVLVVVVIMALVGYQYLDLMTAEYRMSQNVYRTAQTRALAESGVNYAAAMLSNKMMFDDMLGGNPYDNPMFFHDVVVSADEFTGQVGRFSIVAPMQEPGMQGFGGIRFGVMDESGKINLNAMMKRDRRGRSLQNALRQLPYMTEDIAAAIVDWLDADSETREDGAEDDVYSAMTPPYRAKNGPLESLDELLLVRGVTPQLLYGNDLNRNGMIDGNEISNDPFMDLGWAAYLTIYSREQNISYDGMQRINLNERDLQSLYNKLINTVGEEMAGYIILARQYGTKQLAVDGAEDSGDSGGSGGSGGSSGESKDSGDASAAEEGQDVSSVKLDFNQRGRRGIRSMLSLMNSQVRIPGKEITRGKKKIKLPDTLVNSPLNNPEAQQQLLPLLFDQTTASNRPELSGRINVNTAPEPVLAALPHLDEQDVQRIIANRPPPGMIQDPIYHTPAWLILYAGIDPRKIQRLEWSITTQSQVYRVQVVGYFDELGPYSRVEAVIDTNSGRPRILHFKDLTVLGKGFALPVGF